MSNLEKLKSLASIRDSKTNNHKKNTHKSTKYIKPKKSAQNKTSRATSIYFTPDDEKHIDDAFRYAMNSGIRPSNALIIRAAVKLLAHDKTFINELEKLKSEDGRRK
jgi:type II secretory pathway component GspD/PulD (secretin)